MLKKALCYGMLLLGVSTELQAETCAEIWTTAFRSNSSVPAAVSYSPVNPTTINSLSGTLAPGDYILSNGNVGNNTVLTTTGATVRIFVNGSLSIGTNSELNANGSAANLLIVATGSIAVGNNVVINGFTLAGGALSAGNNVLFRGAITAKGAISGGNNSGVIYQPEVLSELQGGVVCGGGLSCFSDDFQNSALSSNWATSTSSGSFSPSVVANRLRLTQNVGNQATAATYQRLFPGSQNLVTIEFDQLAYGKTGSEGADGIAVVLSDASVTPQPGSYGGPLGYGSRSGAGISGFAGGWLGVGLDEYGNFSAEGGTAGPGRRRQSVVVRGSGSGTAGYRYLAGTCGNGSSNTGVACLSPTVDGNQASPHRYRITIDSQVAGQSQVKVERDSGSGFQTMIGNFNANSAVGQSAVPDNFLLTFTGSTGGSNNIHELDNLQICALKSSPVGEQIDHFQFNYSGNALTCNPETFTVIACKNASCSETVNSQVSATLTPGTGWLSGTGLVGNVLNFSGGSATAVLSKTTAGTVLVGVTGSTPSTKPLSSTLCHNGSSLSAANCNVNFAESGFVLDVPNKLANQPATGIQIKAVKTNASNQCIPAFANVSRTLKLWSDRVSPGTHPAASPPSVQVNNLDVGQSSASATSQSLSFNASGIATVAVNYADAGQMRLNVRYDGSSATNDSGLLMTGADLFVSSPAGLCLTTVQNCALAANDAAYASCALYQKAGATLPLTITAKAWQAGGSSNFCSNGNTPNFNLSNIPMQVQLLAPSAGVNAVLTPTNYTHSASTSASQQVNIKLSEIGVFRLSAGSTSLVYLGTGLSLFGIQASALGRLGPDHFTLDSGSVTPACGSFSYLDQPMAGQFGLSARNADGQVTQNYFGHFAKAQVQLQAEDQNNGIELSGRLSSNPAVLQNWLQGQLIYNNLPLIMARQSVEDGPFPQWQAALKLSDNDPSSIAAAALNALDNNVNTTGVCNPVSSCTSKQLGTIQNIRYGRLRILNAVGSEQTPLPVQLKAEYFNGQQFVQNYLDQCSVVQPGLLSVSGSPVLSVTGNNTVLQQGISGAFDLRLSAPGTPTVRQLSYQLNAYPWLQYDWTPAVAPILENPQAEAWFGGYRGSNRQIYWREQ